MPAAASSITLAGMRASFIKLMVSALILGGSLAAPIHAKPDKQEIRERAERSEREDRSERKHSRKGVLGRDEAARRAQRQYGGRVLSVDLLQSDDLPARYRVKLLSNGNVRTVDVDALED
jgi:uncharacterized membrane protein YkoI